MEEALYTTITYLTLLIDAVGTVTIGVTVVLSILPFFHWVATGRRLSPNIRLVRARLGRGLVLGLEFLIGADILRTLLDPSPTDVLVLGAIIILRTILSLSIEYELVHLTKSTEDGGYQRPSTPSTDRSRE